MVKIRYNRSTGTMLSLVNKTYLPQVEYEETKERWELFKVRGYDAYFVLVDEYTEEERLVEEPVSFGSGDDAEEWEPLDEDEMKDSE
ncbi:MAG TPA: hypothetical protein DHN29_22845 [Cytophagales bacterium]|nr:hypothetical protein [Cytophagales bacterium]